MTDFDSRVERRAAVIIGLIAATISGSLLGAAAGSTVYMIVIMARMVRL
jgi:hypothetical protein